MNATYALLKGVALLLLPLLIMFSPQKLYAQPCEPDVPHFDVDLSSNPDTTWLVPDVQRNGKCCDAAKNAPCVQFTIELHPDAQAIAFDICEGAKPSGSLYYQINCGPRTPVGQPICITDEGPHILTFCKPGANTNTFCIRSLPTPKAGPDVTLQEGCSVALSASGFDPENVTWTSVSPGSRGDFDYLLDCTSNCLNPNFDAAGVLPDSIVYEVCGFNSGGCNPLTACDSITVFIEPGPQVVIKAEEKVLCSAGDRLLLTAEIVGGSPPYQINWSNGSTGSTTEVGAGTHTVSVVDALNCDPVTASFTVPEPKPIVLNISATAVQCNGGSDGSATVTISGGYAPFEILWDDPAGQQDATATGLSSGIYTATVTDSAGCTQSISVNVPQPSNPLQGSIQSITDVACKGESTGSATVSAVGGTTPYTFLWNDTESQSGQTASNLPAGSYTVTIIDANGCETALTVEIEEPLSYLQLTPDVVHVKCNGGNSGSVTLTGEGGTPPYQFRKNTDPYQSGNTFTGLGFGVYTFTVRDANGCIETVQVEIEQPTEPLSGSIAEFDANCAGSKDGTARAAVSGGTQPYSYQWNDPQNQNGSEAVGLAAGTYIVTVTDANGCLLQLSATIEEPPPIVLDITSQDVLCFGEDQGSATVTVQGGTSPYSYLWNDAQNQKTATATNLSSGTYTVTVTDANLCSQSATVTVSEPADPLQVQMDHVSMVSCFGGSDGSAHAIVTGGEAPYSYQWNDPGNQTTATVSGLSAGTYSVTVTDINGCEVIKTVNILQPESPLSVDAVMVNTVSCNGGSDGKASAEASGGTAPYTYQWNDPAGQNTQQAEGLSAGTYTVVATDQNGCQASVQVQITEPPVLAPQLISTTDVKCKGDLTGEAEASATGGTAPYSYQWNDPANQTAARAINLAAGDYVVTVTDARGCAAQLSVSINEPANELTASLAFKQNVSCYGASDGSATVTPSGGTSPYTYQWNDPNNQTTASATNLSAGQYSVTVTDANGCIAVLPVMITAPSSPLAISLQVTSHVSCFGGNDGSASVTVSGGTPPYNVNWSAGTTSGNSVSGLTAGNYSVFVQDANGCAASQPFVITQPDPVSAAISNTEAVDCHGGSNGSLTVTPSGGTAPYTYQWNDPAAQTSATAVNLSAGTYSVLVTDANGCPVTINGSVGQPQSPLSVQINVSAVKCKDGNTGTASGTVSGGTPPYSYFWDDPQEQQTSVATNLIAGTYVVTVTDFNGCQISGTAVVSEPASPLQADVSSTPAGCNGASDGSATVVPSGGQGPYSFQWNDPAGQTGATANNLTKGEYEVEVQDANGCVITASVSVSEPNVMELSLDYSEVVCNSTNNGIVSVSVVGGTAPYSYLWDDQSGTTSNTAENLPAGTYQVTVTDANGCQEQASVTLTQDILYSVTLEGTDVSCNGGNDGQIISSIQGGQQPFSYVWSPGGQTSTNRINITAGTYTLQVVDNDGCPATAQATIEEPQPLQVALSATDVSCFGDENGTATVAVTGGIPPYTFQWNDPGNQNTATASQLAAGNYSVTITDANLCTVTGDVTVGSPTQISIALTPTHINCRGEKTGSIVAGVGGGNSPYSYQWNDPEAQQTATATGLAAGNYTLEVTDDLGCKRSASQIVTEPASVLSVQTFWTNVACKGESTGTATVNVSGGTPGYTYQWNDPLMQTSPTATNLGAGSYTVTINDANGCVETRTIIIAEPDELLDLSLSAKMAVCRGDGNGEALAEVTGGVQPYTYSWSDSLKQTTSRAVGLPAGTYSVVIVDGVGCEISGSVFVQEPSEFLTLDTDGSTVDCFGDEDGVVSVISSGGQAPYTYQWNDAMSQKTAAANNLGIGRYKVVVTDNNGCQKVDSADVLGPNGPLLLSFNKTNTSCFEGSDGTAELQVTGGNGGYIYNWNDPAGSSTAKITGLQPGYYAVEVRDAKNCSVTDSVRIDQPDSLQILLVQNDVKCFGDASGDAEVLVSGGTTPYKYQWSSGITDTLSVVEGLKKGTYQIGVTDASGCKINGIVEIDQPESPISVSVASTRVLCHGAKTGRTWAIAIGGTAPYTYMWDDPLNQVGDTAYNLGANRYKVWVTDMNQCMDSAEVVVSQPAEPVSIDVQSTPTTCFGSSDGAASATPKGGEGDYTFQWNDPANQTDAVAKGLKQGDYFIKVTDGNGCVAIEPVTVGGPDQPLQVSVKIDPVTCFNGSDGAAEASVTGGTEPYFFFWDVPGGGNQASVTNLAVGTYSVRITDANECETSSNVTVPGPEKPLSLATTVQNVLCFGDDNGSATVEVSGGVTPYTYSWNDPESQQTRRANDLKPGIYQVIVEDKNGCTDFAEVEVLAPAKPIDLLLSGREPTCFGYANGQVRVEADGGTKPYRFNWNIPNAGNQSTVGGLAAGLYFVDVIDTNGCRLRDTIALDHPDELRAELEVTDVKCYGAQDGTINMDATGGTPNYTYNLNNGAQFNNTGEFFNLPPGRYTLQVTDLNNCFYQRVVNVEEPELIEVNTQVQDVQCYGQENGGVRIQVVGGGTIPYAISWSNGPFQDTTIYKASALTPGNYTYAVRDGNDCVEPGFIQISEPAPLNLTPSGPDTICFGDEVIISVSASGGTGNLDPNWSHGLISAFSHQVSPDSTVIYTVFVADSNNCRTPKVNIPVAVQDMRLENLALTAPDTVCSGLEVVVTAQHEKTIGPYQYDWNPDLGNDVGPYNLQVDSNDIWVRLVVRNNCNQTLADSVLIRSVPTPQIFLGDTAAAGCAALDVTFVDTLNSNSGILDYYWQMGDGTTKEGIPLLHTYENSGEYLVRLRIVSPYGCENESEGPHKVVVNPSPLAVVEASDIETDIRTPEIQFFNQSEGYTDWIWTFGDGSMSDEMDPVKVYADTGRYYASISVANQFGCVDEQGLWIQINPYVKFVVPTAFTPNQGGGNGGEYDPNDLSNDIFYPITQYVETFNMKIFNRWGELVFESRDINRGWDGYYKGKMAQQDVYIWRIEATFTTGETVSETGDVTLFWK